MTTYTPRGAPELVSAQAVPETTVNEQIRRTEAGAGRFPVADRVTAPPGTCADGATYLITATATGAFLGKENQLATAVGTNAASGWYYRTLGTIDEGVLAYVQDEDAEYKWSGAAWAIVSLSSYTDEQAQDAVASLLTAGTGISLSYNDAGNALTITNTAPSAGSYTDENARDAIGTALVAGTGISITVNDAGDTITINNTGGSGGASSVVTDTFNPVPAANTGGTGARGGLVVATYTFQIKSLSFRHDVETGATYRAMVVTLDGSNTVLSIVAQKTLVAGTDISVTSTVNTYKYTFSSAATITSGTRYGFIIVREGISGSAAFAMDGTASNANFGRLVQAGMQKIDTYLRLATNSVTVGTTFSSGSDSYWWAAGVVVSS